MNQLPTPLHAVLSRLGPLLPTALTSAHLVAGLEVARRLQWLTPPAELDGKRFCIEVTDLRLNHYFSCRGQRFRRLPQSAVDLTLSAAANDFLALLLGRVDADTLFFQRRLAVAGDTELGLIVKNWLDATERPAWLARLAERQA